MTQEAFKAWWYNEGSQAPYTHHDCEEHTMRMCEIAWANGAYKALADHAMSKVQRLGQEIEPDDIASIIACRDMLDAQPVPPQRKPLTDEQIESLLMNWPEDGIAFFEFARAIEAAHGIKGDA